jgi:hypothetical protein
VASICSGERARKKERICRSRPGQLTAVLATQFFSAAQIRSPRSAGRRVQLARTCGSRLQNRS